MRLRFQRDRLRSLTISFVSRFLAVFIISSFAVTLLPVVSSAESSMPCCAGKSSEHCDSGLAKPKPRPVITEPMCGLPQSSVPQKSLLNAGTTSQQHVHAESNTSRVTAESLGKPCRMDCGACATAVSRQARDKSVIHSRTTQTTPSTIVARYNSQATVYSSNENWTRKSPRGPPSTL